MRINKYLALCGLGSRRKCEDLITNGKIKVNGRIQTALAFDVGETDEVLYNEAPVQPAENLVYIKFHKPKSCVCTASDELGRKTIFDVLKEPPANVRLFSVGRLDYDTEGLLLLTNDGDLANKLMHPSNEVEKTYVAVLNSSITDDSIAQIRAGVTLDDGYKTRPVKIQRAVAAEEGKAAKNKTRLEITITEGKNRQIRRMFEAVGVEVAFLKRKSVGQINLGGVPRGSWQYLSSKEINYSKKI